MSEELQTVNFINFDLGQQLCAVWKWVSTIMFSSSFISFFMVMRFSVILDHCKVIYAISSSLAQQQLYKWN